MQTAAAYIRVSTEDQIEYSPDSQRKKIQEYAGHHGIILPEKFIYLDEGISGRYAGKRPAFMRMIGTAKQKPRPFDLILVWKFSRFARSRQDSILYKSMLRKECGIDVVSITEQLSDDPTAILIEALLEAMDEYYSINLAQEVRRGMNEKFSRGGVVSVPPFGYRMGTEHFEIDEKNAPFVPVIFKDFLNGTSCRQIAARLNEWNIRTIRGNPFESRTVKYILTNPVYLGKLRRTAEKVNPVKNTEFKKEMHIVDGKHIPLIDQKTYDEVQERMIRTKEKHVPSAPSSPAAYMLHGLVRCSRCGSILTSSEKGKSLQCCQYVKGKCSISHHIRLEKLNQAVLSTLEKDLKIDSLKLHIQAVSKSETDTLHLLIDREKRCLDRIKTAYESGIDTLEEYRVRKADALTRIRKLQQSITESQSTDSILLTENIRISFRKLIQLLKTDKITEQSKNMFLRSFISRIIFFRPEDSVQIFYHI